MARLRSDWNQGFVDGMEITMESDAKGVEQLQAELARVKQERDVYQHAASDFDETAKAFRDDRDAIMKRAEQTEADLSEALEGLPLIDKLLEWMPPCSKGSSGYIRREAVEKWAARLRALASRYEDSKE